MIKLWKYIPSFMGKRRLMNFLYRKFIAKSKNITFRSRHNLQFIAPNLLDNISFELFFEGIYEETLIKCIVQELPQNGIFIDVGANIGAVSVFVAMQRPDVTIFAFEASPTIYTYLALNITQNKLENVHALNLAVHTENDLELDFYAPRDKFGKGSFVNTFECLPEKTKTIRLESFFEQQGIHPDLIKVDVEGFEVLIFKSLGKYLTESAKPKIIFEFVDWAERESSLFSPGDAQKFLIDNQYQLHLLNDYVKNLSKSSIHNVAECGSFEIIAIPI